jgi:DNA-binding NarL/FixJ family response regulator
MLIPRLSDYEGNGMKDTITVDMEEYVPALRSDCDEPPDLGVLANGEKDVLVGLTEGFTNKEIAIRLGLGVRAVEAHRERLMRKLRIRGVARLTQYAVSRGMVALDGGTESSRPMPCAD